MEKIWYNTTTGPYSWPITIPGVVISRTAKRVKIAIPHKYKRGEVMVKSVTPAHIEPRTEAHKFDEEYQNAHTAIG